MSAETTACDHRNTLVKSSRPPDHVGSHGKPMFKPRPFRCEVIRRRLCLDCGHRFSTYEVPEDAMDALLARAADRAEIVEAVLREMRAYLLGGQDGERNHATDTPREENPMTPHSRKAPAC